MILIFLVDSENFQVIIKHPVHIVDDDGHLWPTALIPFCEFGGNLSVMGVKTDQFDVPVCSSFRPKIIQDQLCYTVDPNHFRELNENKELSVTLFINYNEDRQMPFSEDKERTEEEDNFIFIETIGEEC